MLPPDAFPQPEGENRLLLESLGQQVLQLLLEEAGSAAGRSPLPSADLSQLDVAIPAQGTTLETLLDPLRRLIQQSMNPANPGYLAHMDPAANTASVLGETVAAFLNNNLLSVEMSPVLSRLEVQLLQYLAHQFGLPPGSGGLLTSGGTLANLQALAVARNRALPVQKTGLVHLPGRPLIFASAVAHTSLQKAAMLLGLGSEGVVPVPVDAHSRLQPEALEQLIQQAQQEGDLPICVVATAGTTVTGSLDPLVECGAIARRYGLWFHVDASYGGAICFSPRYRDLLTGIEQADSITFNPQKWLCVAKTSAMLLLRDWSELERHFRVSAPYMNEAADLINLGEVSVQGTRSADILKLWLTLQHFGQAGCAALVEQGFELAQYLQRAIAQRPWLELATPLQTNILCFRVRGADDGQQQQLQRQLLVDGFALSLPRYQNQLWLKAVLVNPHTTTATLDHLIASLDQAGLSTSHRLAESVC